MKLKMKPNMKLQRLFFISMIALSISFASTICEADTKLEVGLDLASTFINDASYEAFSLGDPLIMGHIGGQLRLALDTPWKHIQVAPLVGYMGAIDNGNPYGIIDTTLAIHEFFAGARARGWLVSWMSVFAQVHGGLVLAHMSGELSDCYSNCDDIPHIYNANDKTWSAGGLLGVELRLSPRMLARRHVTRFNIGGWIGAGYNRRGNISFTPKAEGGDEYTLDVKQTSDWGTINLSGFILKMGLTASFF